MEYLAIYRELEVGKIIEVSGVNVGDVLAKMYGRAAIFEIKKATR